jgi:adenosylcobinamide-phosphate synthase
MSLFSLIVVLLLEQVRPLPYQKFVHGPLARLADFLEARFNAGEPGQGMVAWLIAVPGLTLGVGLIYLLLHSINPLLALACNIGVLYLTMGFRQFSHYYTDIQLALRMGDLAHARRLLAEWRGQPADDLSSSEIARLAIEEALAASHRHVFGVLLWFVLLPGPCGAVLYRSASFFSDYWGAKRENYRRQPFSAGSAEIVGLTDLTESVFGDFGSFAQRVFAIIDWLPLRVTAAGFAIVGNFEDAILCWRTQAANWPDGGLGIVLASGAGALGVRLGMPVVEAGEVAGRADIAIGDAADVDFMQSAVGLVWRALVLWLLLLLLLVLASLVGG